jgi:hypothetical protein
MGFAYTKTGAHSATVAPFIARHFAGEGVKSYADFKNNRQHLTTTAAPPQYSNSPQPGQTPPPPGPHS